MHQWLFIDHWLISSMSDHDSQLSPRYEVRIHWESGKKRFAVHDLQQSDRVVEMFDSVKEASIHCALLCLDHVRAMRGGGSLTSFPSQRSSKIP
jgi:hypothetical protein